MIVMVEREDTHARDRLPHLVTEVARAMKKSKRKVARVMKNSKRKVVTIILLGRTLQRESNQSLTGKVVKEDAHAAAATRSAKTSPPQSSKARARELHSSRSRSQAAGTSVAGATTNRRPTREVGVKR